MVKLNLFLNIKKIIALCLLPFAFCLLPLVAFCATEDPFQFENFAIVESDDADVTAPPVEMNIDAPAAPVATFDIAGIFLGMSYDDVHNLFFRGKYLYTPRKKNSVIYTMHKDWKYNLDYECRGQKIFIPSDLEQCINSMARARGLLYVSEIHLIREQTGETIDVYFTSNATDNLVWRVVYNNDVNEVPGDNEKFENQRQKKILSFWSGVLDKYGAPNSGADKWLSSGNSYDPQMTAYYGSLDLVDMGRNANDAARNVTDARENFRSKPYAF